MKVVFPCKGALVLLKQDLDTLKAFYKSSILTSKLSETYKNSNIMVQVGNFNYIPQKSSLVLYKANVLTIEKMRKILGIYRESSINNKSTTQKKEVTQQNFVEHNTAPISDNDLLSNPFFQTLKPLN